MKTVFYLTLWMPILFCMGLVFRCAVLVSGGDVEALRSLFSAPPIGAAFFYYLSDWMKFCWVHKSVICYVGVVNVLTMLQDYHLFDGCLQIMRIALLVVGSVLLLFLMWKMYVRKEKISRYCPRRRRVGHGK